MDNLSTTPEWLKGINISSALEHLEYDIGVIAAKLTMMKQRVSDLRTMVEKEKNDREISGRG